MTVSPNICRMIAYAYRPTKVKTLNEMPNIETEEKTNFLSNQKIITKSDPDFNCFLTFKEESVSKRCWRRMKRIPGLGLILVILKNLLAIIADSVVKKIDNIGKF